MQDSHVTIPVSPMRCPQPRLPGLMAGGRSRSITRWVVAAVMTCLVAGNSLADEGLSKWAATELDEVDADFAYQGEYCGRLGNTSCGPVVGLQVVALGDGHFSAVQYQGGLPGTGWWGGASKKLAGRIQDGVLHLSNKSHDIFLTPQTAVVNRHPQGLLGQLYKTHRVSRTLGASPPPSAIRLFDGTTTAYFKDARITRLGWLDMGTELLESYQDYSLHIEFKLPYMPHARGQDRANSGVYLQSRYEVQVLDSFGLEGRNNECGAVYTYRRPDLNMCLPPLRWQTYDIHFRSPRFDRYARKVCNARLTVVHNGVTVHNNIEVERKTGAGKAETPALLPIKLQDHGNPVHFRNIWLIPCNSHGCRATRCNLCPEPCLNCRCASRPRGLLRGLFGRRRRIFAFGP